MPGITVIQCNLQRKLVLRIPLQVLRVCVRGNSNPMQEHPQSTQPAIARIQASFPAGEGTTSSMPRLITRASCRFANGLSLREDTKA